MLIVVTDAYETQSVGGCAGAPPDLEVVEQGLQILSNFLNSQLWGDRFVN